VFRELAEFRDGHPRAGVLIVRGVEVGDVGPTPASPSDAVGANPTSERSLTSAAAALGALVGYLPEQGGALVQNLLPTPDSADRQTSTSSRVTLAFHTETAFHPHLPRYLVLLCLRGDPAATTTWCIVDDALDAVPAELVDVLRRPRFRCGVDESFTHGVPTGLLPPRPIVWGDPAAPSWTFDADLMVGTDLEAQEALEVLTAAVDARQRGVVLEAGDLLVLDNTLVVHGRSPFPARFDGTDRWLQRSFVVADLDAVADRDGQVITTTFI
jgi:alpha-ketoglutarate-dependent taurine dioxygenase